MGHAAARTDRKQRWHRRKEARPREILDAALDLFVERGFSATKLADVARHAGISKGTLYLYFASKDTLFRAMVKELVLPELARVERQVAGHAGSGRDLLRDLVAAWWGMVGDSRLCGIPKLMVAEAGNFPELARFFVEQVVRRMRRIFARVIRTGIERGEFRACNAEYAARVLIAPLVFAAIWQRSLAPYDRTPYDARQYLESHLDMALNGLLAEGDSR